MNIDVIAYLVFAGVTHTFPARDMNHAREIASRIVQEGLHVQHSDGTEEFWPTDKVMKVKIKRGREFLPNLDTPNP